MTYLVFSSSSNNKMIVTSDLYESGALENTLRQTWSNIYHQCRKNEKSFIVKQFTNRYLKVHYMLT
jgi:hypothetical protein